ncbi:SMI1/KNR4 family protein [Rhizobium panacihumi]|uniref:SMI1/KNR4 family protein n=1 Tax=Rhizobium panacihumi TaxID=2008450 RepID=UPI003D7BBA1C
MSAYDLAGLFDQSSVTRAATEEEIAETERQVGPLPECYKRFAATFGYGTTNNLFIIEMPFAVTEDRGLIERGGFLRDQVRWLVDGHREDGLEIGEEDCLEAYDEESRDVAAFFHRLQFFGKSENGEYLCWRSIGDGMFRFHVIDRACLSIRYGGASLIDFIRASQTDAVKTMLGAGYERLPRTFAGVTA